GVPILRLRPTSARSCGLLPTFLPGYSSAQVRWGTVKLFDRVAMVTHVFVDLGAHGRGLRSRQDLGLLPFSSGDQGAQLLGRQSGDINGHERFPWKWRSQDSPACTNAATSSLDGLCPGPWPRSSIEVLNGIEVHSARVSRLGLIQTVYD